MQNLYEFKNLANIDNIENDQERISLIKSALQEEKKSQYLHLIHTMGCSAKVLEEIICAGGNINYADPTTGSNILASVILSNKELSRKINYLLEGGININAIVSREHNNTILHFLAINEFEERFLLIMSIIGEKNIPIDLSIKDKYGKTPLMTCVRVISYQMTKAILEFDKSTINVPDFSGKTPLHYACLLGNEKIVTLLLEHGADLNIQDENENTVLDTLLLSKELVETTLIEVSIDPRRDAAAKHNALKDKNGVEIFFPIDASKNLIPNKCVCDCHKNDNSGIEALLCIENKTILEANSKFFYEQCKDDLERDIELEQLNNLIGVPLIHACMKGKLKCLEIILDPRYNINIKLTQQFLKSPDDFFDKKNDAMYGLEYIKNKLINHAVKDFITMALGTNFMKMYIETNRAAWSIKENEIILEKQLIPQQKDREWFQNKLVQSGIHKEDIHFDPIPKEAGVFNYKMRISNIDKIVSLIFCLFPPQPQTTEALSSHKLL